ncbi:MAG TPA: rhodanese-like domain-containing protein [Pelovirga sp.]|nr:rhodanese-like domain-containing protein [Pelovirga sp.]
MRSNPFFRLAFFLTFTLTCLLLLPFSSVAAELPQNSDQIPRISIIELQEWQEQEPVVIVDARVARAWKRAGNKIPAAIRLDTPEKIAQFADSTNRQQAILVYCL